MRNDSKEGKFITELYQRSCKELLDKKKITDEQHEIIKDLEPNFRYPLFEKANDGSVKYRIVSCTPYIVCFSGSENMKNLWEEYLHKEDGCALSFWLDERLLNESVGLGGGQSNFLKIFRVDYDLEKTVSKLKEIVLKLLEIFRDDDFQLKESIVAVLSEYRIFVKSDRTDDGKETKDERETRIVFLVPNDHSLNNPLYLSAKKCLCNQYCTEEDGKTVFRDVDFANEKYVWISAEGIITPTITLSPNCSLSVDDMREILIKSGFPEDCICVYRHDYRSTMKRA
jgi:hypothetical protein